MNHGFKRLLVAASAGLGACALVPLPGEPAAHKVTVGGESYFLRQITDSTWTASSMTTLKMLPTTPAGTAALQQAVEKTSGCTVTDSDYSREGRQFDAQVSCPRSLGN
ncbi:hypothetical protein BH10PSE16_BH10PSE16_18800 [soil metagenome]